MQPTLAKETSVNLLAVIFHAALHAKGEGAHACSAVAACGRFIHELARAGLRVQPLTGEPDVVGDLLVNDTIVVRVVPSNMPHTDQEAGFRTCLHALGKDDGVLVDFSRRLLVDGVKMVNAGSKAGQRLQGERS